MITLKFDTAINGDATAKGFEKQIRLQSASFCTDRQLVIENGSQTRQTHPPTVTEVSCAKEFDIASTELFMQSVSGKSLGNATLTFLQTDEKGNPKKFLEITLAEAIITGYAHSASAGQKPHETFRINFTEMKLAFTENDGEKSTEATAKGWNFQTSAAAA